MNEKNNSEINADAECCPDHEACTVFNCPIHGRQNVVIKAGKEFCLECIGELLEKFIKPLR